MIITVQSSPLVDSCVNTEFVKFKRNTHAYSVLDNGYPQGYMKVSVLFYGYYDHNKSMGGSHYRLPLAYLLTGGATFAASFIVILRK